MVASEIRLIQRKGRTARHREGKVVILYCKGTHDEIYLTIALRKLKKMNIHLKNPQQLTHSYSSQNDKDHYKIESVKNKKLYDNKVSDKKIQKRIYQSNLQSFLSSQEPSPEGEKKEEAETGIKISKFFPMKFGLRKKLQEEEVDFEIVDSDLHLIIFNEVLIQIFDPKKYSLQELMPKIEEFREISTLLIIVFDFTDFREEIEGERRILKRRLNEYGIEHNLHIISIDNLEELYFIIKSILENPQKKVLQNE